MMRSPFDLCGALIDKQKNKGNEMSFNRCILVGRLEKDPETRAFPRDTSLCKFILATSESWEDKQTGERKERTEWHRVVLRGLLGETAQQHLRKGSRVYIEGSIHTNKWQDRIGEDHYSTEIIANEMRILDSKGASDEGCQHIKKK